MPSTLAAEPTRPRSRQSEPTPGPSSPTAGSLGSPAGMPAFLQFSLGEPQIQAKCAKCEEEDEEQQHPAAPAVQTKCAACKEEEESEEAAHPAEPAVQTKCAACREEEEEKEQQQVQSKQAPGGQPGAVHSAARAGVAGASQPIPHLDRIQASFGRHDVTGARVAIGGTAARANARMGALAYTAGDRIAFR